MTTAIAARKTESTFRRLLLLAIILVSYGRVVWELGTKNLWWDESLSLQRAESALLPLLKGHLVIYDGFSQLLTIDQHPFMFFLLQGGLLRLAGDSEFSLRYVSVMAATLLPAVLWVLARWFVRQEIFPASAPYWAAGFAAISPFFLWFGQEARPYALWGMLAPLSTYLLLRTTEAKDFRWGWFAGFLLAELMFLTSHFYAVFLLPVHALIFYLWLAKRSRALALTISALILAIGALIGLAAYWFFIVIQAGGENFSLVRLKVLIPDLLNAFSLGLSVDINRVWWIDLLFGALMLLGAGWAVRSRNAIKQGGWLPALLVVVPVCMLLLVNLVLPAYMTARQMAVIGGAMLLLLGGGLGVIARYQRWVAAAVALLLIAATAYSTLNYFTLEDYRKGDLAGLGSYIEDRLAPGDLILIRSPFSWRIADYYLPLEAVASAQAEGTHIGRYGTPLLNVGWEENPPLLQQFKEDYNRIWLVRIGPHLISDLDGNVEQWFNENMYLLRDKTFFSRSTLHAFLYLPEVPVYPEPAAHMEHPAEIVFGDRIRLVGYDIGEIAGPDLALPVTLHWQAMDDLDDNYKYLMQLVEAPANEGSIPLSTTEREPYDGAVATGFWDQGVNIVEWTELPPPLPAALSENPAAFQIKLQLYHRDTLEKLPVTESENLEVLPDGATVVLPIEMAAQ